MTVYKILGKKNMKMLLEMNVVSTQPHPSLGVLKINFDCKLN